MILFARTSTEPVELTVVSLISAVTFLLITSTLTSPPIAALPNDNAIVPPLVKMFEVSCALTRTLPLLIISPYTCALIVSTITFALIFAATAALLPETETPTGNMVISSTAIDFTVTSPFASIFEPFSSNEVTWLLYTSAIKFADAAAPPFEAATAAVIPQRLLKYKDWIATSPSDFNTELLIAWETTSDKNTFAIPFTFIACPSPVCKPKLTAKKDKSSSSFALILIEPDFSTVNLSASAVTSELLTFTIAPIPTPTPESALEKFTPPAMLKFWTVSTALTSTSPVDFIVVPTPVFTILPSLSFTTFPLSS